MKRIIEGIIIGAVLTALTASAKAFIDVNRLQVENKSIKETLIDIKTDVREIRAHLLGD